ncbi:MAG: hypothetical protein Q8L62_01200 [Candidatus Nitrotoga sp.]|nr:hypothetical protein [Candidatus Nitrotoga sp.]
MTLAMLSIPLVSSASVDVPQLFMRTTTTETLLETVGISRQRTIFSELGLEVLCDELPQHGANCCFMRLTSSAPINALTLDLSGGYSFRAVGGGGWVLKSDAPSAPDYWIPRCPMARRLDIDGHILAEREVPLTAFTLRHDCANVTLEKLAVEELDLVLWKLADHAYTSVLDDLSPLERQPYFIYASHTRYSRPADIYTHLVHGTIYGNVAVWPKYWKIADELDAYALYLICAGLHRFTGKKIYDLFQGQIVASVLSRQAPDGGWRHGEWTDGMEAHFRLVAGAVHLLAHARARNNDPELDQALRRAATFLATRRDTVNGEVWFLHDSLEVSMETQHCSPFRWTESRAFGKSPSNMLVLNTHLDTLVALERAADITGDPTHVPLLASARKAAAWALTLSPAQGIYRAIFLLQDLCWLPKAEAMRLPVLKRVLKRIGWKYLEPRIHQVRTWLPRLVMPNGYIDRAVNLKGVAQRYQSVNLWDLTRYLNRHPNEQLDRVLSRAIDYTRNGPLLRFWKEDISRQDAIGFWLEALYHRYASHPEPGLIADMARAVLDLSDVGLGIPPSSLGENDEALVGKYDDAPLSVPDHPALRSLLLAPKGGFELLVVNTSNEDVLISWYPAVPKAWRAGVVVAARSFLLDTVKEISH